MITLKKTGLVAFLLLSLALTLAVFFQNTIWQKKAQLGPLEATFDSFPQGKTRRVWTGFAQGGEEKGLMLGPAAEEIRKIQPQIIRIDHLFDFNEIVKKNSQGELSFDFSSLDARVNEITSLGAIPFLSLSYFPSAFSPNPTEFPPALNEWQTLVEKTIQRYSGKTEKNLLGVYYEVWNEPDLFGKMSPEVYFSLYRESVLASNRCQDCNPFKIGGPAITFYESSWMDKFLSLVSQNQTRLDFISWHSYQLNPEKIVEEVEALKRSKNVYQLPSIPELIISEWGSKPEVSPLHDSYFDAAHTVAVVATVQNVVDKLLAFELKDGPSPEGKKYWGRWGLLTHESSGLTPKPRFYSFLYLNKLLEFRLNPLSFSPTLGVLGSTDGRESYAVVFSRNTNLNDTQLLQLKLNSILPGLYTINVYSLDPLHDPLTPVTNEVSFNGGTFDTTISCPSSCVGLVELVRTSPALVKYLGRTPSPNDFSAKLTSFVPPLVFLLNQKTQDQGLIEFWFKANWGKEENLIYTLLGSKNGKGETISSWIDKTDSGLKIHFVRQLADKSRQETTLPFPEQRNVWHHLSFTFNNQENILSLKIDDEQTKAIFDHDSPVELGSLLYIGANAERNSFAEGLIDDLTISLNNQIIYEKDFNQEVK